ncbi:MAG: hypothetical protein GY795_07540 [Desulfobacterales bacterium]|nr:hypothetical protein [Desulfobacterales bacterium]
MNHAIKGIYNNGEIELIGTPKFSGPVEVLVIFSEEKKIRKIGGLFKEFAIDYDKMEEDLKELSRKSAEKLKRSHK